MQIIDAVAEETVFRNEDNGYTVLTVRTGKSRASAVGVMPPIESGETLHITGEWTQHAIYGEQIKVQSVRIERPTTLLGIRKYLSAGHVKGIGPAMAEELIRHFGEQTLDALADEERLTQVHGIGKKKARMIAQSYAEQTQQREAMIFLQSYGVTPGLAAKIFKQYGDSTQQVLRLNPYRLVDDIEGVGFKTADRIASSLGVEKNSAFRINAGVCFVLEDAMASGGHCYLPRPELVTAAVQVLGCASEDVESAIDTLLLSHRLTAQILPDGQDGQVIAVYQNAAYRAECEVARRLRELLHAMPNTMATDITAQIEQMETMEGIRFHPQQKKAIEMAVTNGMTVVTGGPGTGKTTIIKCIIKLLDMADAEIALAAPTGRAAKRMSEACGMEAMTIHRLLQYDPERGGFAHDEQDPLEVDTLIVDEMSMVDLFLMRSLLRALSPGTRLVMVGDADQLPSVGAGNVLADVISSGAVPAAALTEIFRQDEKSMIVYNAHRINRGEMPRLNARGSDFFFEHASSPADAAARIVGLCAERLPKFTGLDPVRQMQVLSPTKKGAAGVVALNVLLQARFNPPAPGKSEITRGDTIFREGDKVMQTRNDYKIEWSREGVLGWETGTGVFNGDIGFIDRIDTQEQTLTIRFDDDREADYTYGDLDEIEPAYCVSVHKSQGSEFPVVVMPVVGGPPMLLTRNLLYTAVTRARTLVMLVGGKAQIARMVQNAKIKKRYSALAWRLQTLMTL